MNDNIRNNKRNIIIATTAIVLSLILAVIGVSYAFFSLQVNGEDTTTKIEISTGEAGGITLSGKVENFHISVDAKDMAYKNLGDYYATDNQDKNYADSKEEGIKDLGRIDINGILSETQTCSATIKLEFTTDILEDIQKGDFTLGLIYGEEEQEIDLKNISTEGTTIKFKLDGETQTPTYIKAYLKLNNADRDQSYLANQEMKVKVSVDSFVCKELQGLPPLEALQQTGGEVFAGGGEHTTAVDGMYRYVGTYDQVTNNYICFGTDDTDECLETPDTYMYRIIGITDSNVNASLELEAGQLKIIRATPLKEDDGIKVVQWGSGNLDSSTWDNAIIQKTYLNVTFLNTIDETWKKLIDNPYWWIGDNTSSGGTEATSKKSKNYQIGLMYASDYYNSWDYAKANPSISNPNTDSWLHITHGTSSSSTYNSLYEWTMTRYGLYSSAYHAWDVHTDGTLYYNRVDYTRAVRPVFYLTPNILLSGEGTEDNPFIILEA